MEDKRQEIIEQAATLFHQYGIKSVSMDDIARALGMSKKTLYQYVKDKNDLVESVLDYNLTIFSDLLSTFRDNQLNAIEQFHRYATRIEEHFPKNNPSMHYDLRKYYPSLLNRIIETKDRLVYEANVANLEKGKNEGFYQIDIDTAIISKLQVVFQNYLFNPSNGLISYTDLADKSVIEQVYTYHFRGICTPKGIEELKRIFI